MKKLYKIILLITLALFISCDENKAKDEIKKALDKTVDKATPKPAVTKPVLSATRVRVGQVATFPKVLGHTYELKEEKTGVTLTEASGNKMQITATQAASNVIIVATLDGSTEDSDPIEFVLIEITKPVLSSYRATWDTVITFPKVLGHTYELKEEKTGVTLTGASGNKMQITATQAASNVIIVATLDGGTTESNPIEFTKQAGSTLKFVNIDVPVEYGKSGNTHTQTATNDRAVAGDTGVVAYSISPTGVGASIDTASGKVDFTLRAVGNTFTITARKAQSAKYEAQRASYQLTVAKFKPANKAELKAEITKAIGAHGNNVDLSYIDTSDITSMSNLFQDMRTFNGDISKWDTSSVTNMRYMFYNARAFNRPLNNWTVSSVEDMNAMFNNARLFNQPLDNWDVSKVTDMRDMFRNARAFNQNLSGWANKSGRDITNMFKDATAMLKANKPR